MGAVITKGTVLIVGENRGGKYLCEYTNLLEIMQGENFHIFYCVLIYIILFFCMNSFFYKLYFQYIFCIKINVWLKDTCRDALKVNYKKKSHLLYVITSKVFKCCIQLVARIVNIIIFEPLGNPLLVIPVAFPCVSSPPEGNYTCLVQIWQSGSCV